METFDIDDSETLAPTRAVSSTSSMSAGGALYTFLTLPFNLLANLLRLVFSILHIPVPRLLRPGLGAPNFYRPPPARNHDPRASAERWVRSLEEETGAVRPGSATTASASGAEAGPSSVTHRGGSGTGEAKILPEFMISSYDTFLKLCTDEARIGCVILVSDEHDDVPEFKR
jgi:FAS-associated factor 2